MHHSAKRKLLARSAKFTPMVGRRVSQEPTMHDAISYILSVKKAFHGEPSKYLEFLKILEEVTAHRDDQASGFARVKELFKDHQKLLLGFSVFLPADANITIPPKAEQRAAFDDNKTKRLMIFVEKLMMRFQGDDLHVFESFHELVIMCKVGNKSVGELYQEAVALFQGHEDLIRELSAIFKRPIDTSGSTSTRDK